MKPLFNLQILKRIFFSFALGVSLVSSSSAQTLPTATEIAGSMTIGWNLGNTLEAIGGETAWGNPLTSQRLIDSVKAAGFNTIRLPVAWDTHANQTTNVIDAVWMARVKQVVDYCINRDIYVILNIHWDGGWLEENCTTAKQASVNVKQNTYWTQIANTFKTYDSHLLFASANEPNVADATQMAVLLSYHQTFINAVRATGGNNSSRCLIVQRPSTDIEKTNTLMNTLPTDKIANRLMLEVHYYTPYQFCLMTADADWGKQFYYWGNGKHSATDATRNATWGEEADLDNYFQSMKTKFVDKGYPVIIGEFGAMKRTTLTGAALTLHIASREYYYTYLVKSARCHGLIPVYWDTGSIGDNSFTIFNRNTGAVVDKGAAKALMAGASNCVTAVKDCNGVQNGTAKLDNCGRCTGGNTGKAVCSSTGEAEADACAFDGITETRNTGYKGPSYLNVDNAVGSAITFSVLAANAGAATLSFRYANGGTTDRPAQISLNGTVLPTNLSLPVTGTFTDWKAADLTLTLLKGVNVIKLISATAEGLANIDQIGYVSSGLSKGNCVIMGIDESIESQFVSIYPNPSKHNFNVKLSNAYNIQVIDTDGKLYEEHKNVSNIAFGENLKAGIYFLKIDSKVYKLVKE